MMNQVITFLTTFKTGSKEYQIADMIRRNEFKKETTEYVLDCIKNGTLDFGRVSNA